MRDPDSRAHELLRLIGNLSSFAYQEERPAVIPELVVLQSLFYKSCLSGSEKAGKQIYGFVIHIQLLCETEKRIDLVPVEPCTDDNYHSGCLSL